MIVVSTTYNPPPEARAKCVASVRDVDHYYIDAAEQTHPLSHFQNLITVLKDLNDDEVIVSLVPVLMGEGIPYFANLADAPHRFDDPAVIEGSGATHLRYRVRRH